MRRLLIGSLAAAMLGAAAIAQSPNLPQNQMVPPRPGPPLPGAQTIVPGLPPGTTLRGPANIPQAETNKDVGEESRVTIRTFEKIDRLTRGRKSDEQTKAKSTEQKLWNPSNFKMTIPDSMNKTSKVEAMTVKQSTQKDQAGDESSYAKEPAKSKLAPVKNNVSIKTNSPVQVTVPLD